MTQAPPAPAAAPAAPGFVDTPALLRRLNLVAVVAVVAFGVLSAFLQLLAWQSDGRAGDDTDQLVRVQAIESSMLRADALATNGYLLAGLEPNTRKHEYADAVADVLQKIADAAEAQPADRAALAALNEQIEDYTSSVAQAAVYDRLGYPLGIAYQQTASKQLREVAKPIVEGLVTANQKRSQDAMHGQHPFWLLLVGVLAVGALFYVNQQLARTFRRRFNTGVVIAAAIVAGTTLVTAAVALAASRSNSHTESHAYRDATRAATARTAANDAKAIESLRLINRGAGSTWEPFWDAARDVVEKSTPAGDLRDWKTYVQRHDAIIKLDDSNQWKAAVADATSSGAAGSSEPLDSFNATMDKLATSAGQQASHDLRSGRAIALVLSVLTALLGLVAAVSVTRGIGERQKEFL
ncbi:MAG TPA: hypothetical protein VJ872_08290 [Nocardioides sp.]|nr:hypothetical protein [Nocardioides sp.]